MFTVSWFRARPTSVARPVLFMFLVMSVSGSWSLPPVFLFLVSGSRPVLSISRSRSPVFWARTVFRLSVPRSRFLVPRSRPPVSWSWPSVPGPRFFDLDFLFLDLDRLSLDLDLSLDFLLSWDLSLSDSFRFCTGRLFCARNTKKIIEFGRK